MFIVRKAGENPLVQLVEKREAGSFAYSIAFTLLMKYPVSPKQLVGTPMCCS
jgi:hypothetical protein